MNIYSIQFDTSYINFVFIFGDENDDQGDLTINSDSREISPDTDEINQFLTFQIDDLYISEYDLYFERFKTGAYQLTSSGDRRGRTSYGFRFVIRALDVYKMDACLKQYRDHISEKDNDNKLE